MMAQKSKEIMPHPDAIIRLRRERPLGANLTGCDVNFCWMIQIQKKVPGVMECSPPPLSVGLYVRGNIPLTLTAFYIVSTALTNRNVPFGI